MHISRYVILRVFVVRHYAQHAAGRVLQYVFIHTHMPLSAARAHADGLPTYVERVKEDNGATSIHQTIEGNLQSTPRLLRHQQ